MISKKRYKVTDKNGLTVTSKVFPEGHEFDISLWKWGEDSLKAAIKKERCVLLEDGNGKEKNANEKKFEKLSRKDIKALESELKKLIEDYEKLEDKELEDAKAIEKRIKEIEKELKK